MSLCGWSVPTNQNRGKYLETLYKPLTRGKKIESFEMKLKRRCDNFFLLFFLYLPERKNRKKETGSEKSSE